MYIPPEELLLAKPTLEIEKACWPFLFVCSSCESIYTLASYFLRSNWAGKNGTTVLDVTFRRVKALECIVEDDMKNVGWIWDCG
jgi:hypothetical protein